MLRTEQGCVVRVTTYEGTAMRKHGSFRVEHKAEELAYLDAAASAPTGPRISMLHRRRGLTVGLDVTGLKR